MVNKLLIGALIILFIGGMSFMANAGTNRATLDDKDIVCAVVAFTAGYTEDGIKFAKRIDPFREAQKEYIDGIVDAANKILLDKAPNHDGTTTAAARYYFKRSCQEA